MEESPNQFRQSEPNPTPIRNEPAGMPASTPPTPPTPSKLSYPAWMSRFATPLLIGLGVLLVTGGIVYGLRERASTTVVDLPDYTPAVTRPATDAGDNTESPRPSTDTAKSSELPAATIASQPSPATKQGVVKGVATTVKKVVSSPIASPVAVAQVTTSNLPEYRPVVELPEYAPQYVSPSPSQPAPKQTDTVKLQVSGGASYTAEVTKDSTVMAVMNELKKQGLTFETKSFSFGEQITKINGVAQDSSNYWILSVNGAIAKKGVSEQTVSDGDVIVWTLTRAQ